VNGIDSGSCPVSDFGVETSGSATTECFVKKCGSSATD
jgi:hypothetical protein